MSICRKPMLAAALIVSALSATQLQPAQAYYVHRYRPSTRVVVVQREPFFYRHPVIKSTLVGGALGTGAGLIGGAIAGHHRAGKGALIGLGTGAGIGAVEGSAFGHRHPILRNTATGSLIGLGVGGVMGHHRAWKGAGIGALLGGGLGILRHVNGYY